MRGILGLMACAIVLAGCRGKNEEEAAGDVARGPAATPAVPNLIATVGPLVSVCRAVRRTSSSSTAGSSVTVPLTVRCVGDAASPIGVACVLMLVKLVFVGTGTVEITAAARLSAVMTTS